MLQATLVGILVSGTDVTYTASSDLVPLYSQLLLIIRRTILAGPSDRMSVVAQLITWIVQFYWEHRFTRNRAAWAVPSCTGGTTGEATAKMVTLVCRFFATRRPPWPARGRFENNEPHELAHARSRDDIARKSSHE